MMIEFRVTISVQKEETSMEKETLKHEKAAQGLSSAKREDIWALIIAFVVTVISIAAPDAVHTFFKKMLFFF